MPEICRFLGILVFMRYKEHNPPHFHVWYQGKEAMFAISDGSLIEGKFPKKETSLVTAWAILRKKSSQRIGIFSNKKSP